MNMQNLEGFRVSPQQRRLWLSARGEGRAACLLELRGPLEGDRLERALRRIVARHEILRTAFPSLPGMETPLQVIRGEDAGLAFSYTSVEQPGAPDLDALFAQRAPFEFSEGPLLSARLTRVEEARHFLLLELPSICCDAASLDVLVEELVASYAGGAPAEGEGGPLQYADFSEWQHELLDEPDAARWREREELSGEPVVLHVESSTGPVAAAPLTVSASIPRGELAGLAGDTPLDAFFFACWSTLLFRLAPEEDRDRLVVDVRFDLRHLDALAGAIGAFAKLIPVRCSLGAEAGIGEEVRRLAAVLEETGAGQEHFDAELLPGHKGRAGFAFAFERALDPRDAAGLRVEVLRKQCEGERNKLSLAVRAGAGEVEVHLTAGSGIVSRERLRLLLDSLVALARQAARAPGTPLFALGLIGPAEAEQLASFGQNPAHFPGGDTLHGLFERQALATPDAPAVVYAGDVLSFDALNRRANRVAHALRACGVGPEAIVPLVYERSVEMMVGLLGILKAGAAYLPVDPHQPRARLALILGDARARHAVVQPGLEDAVRGALGAGAPELQLVSTRVSEGPEHNPSSGVLPENLAYVIYTSGSTGTPKGTLVTHASAVNLAHAERRMLGLEAGPPLRVGLNAPLIFDASIKQLLLMLFGHSLHVVPEEVRPDGRALVEFLRAARLDVLDLTPSQMKLLLFAEIERNIEVLPARVLLGGEALDADTWERLRALGDRFHNVYGPTENTDISTMIPLSASERPTIGSPIANVRVHVLDHHLSPVPVGVPGELYLSGKGLSRGYFGRSALTAERFLPSPFGPEPGARLYRTGDLVRHREDGLIEFIGRVDRQVKIRGFRVELGEIEAALRRHPGVREAVVVLREDQPGDPRLAAYVVPSPKGSPAALGRPRHVLPNDMAVVQQNKNETDYLYEEIFRKKTYSLYGIEIPRGAVVFDVGANIGMYSLYVTLHAEDARIFAFEPLAPIYATLAANAALYGRDIKLFHHGLSDREETVAFTYYPRYSMMSGAEAFARPEEEVEVVKRFLTKETEAGSSEAAQLLSHADELLAGRFQGEVHNCLLRRLSDVIREEGVDHIDLLKVDVQRAEMHVLRGLTAGDWKIIDQVVMEVHAAEGQESEGRLEELEALLRQHGFEVILEQDELLSGTDRYNVYASRRGLRGREEGLMSLRPLQGYIDEARPVSPGALRDHAREHLPEHMVPSAVVLMDGIPLTRNGKVDHRLLPVPDAVAGGASARHEPPRTPIEEILHGIWCELLGTPHLGIHDDFFQLGGHSLLATQLTARVRQALHLDVPLRALFDAPTIAQMAPEVERLLKEQGGAGVAPPIEPRAGGGELPLTFSQERLWFLQALTPEGVHYNTPAAVRARGELSLEVLGRVLTEIVRRHEVLRTVFSERDGVPVQVVREPGAVAVSVEEAAAGLGLEEREAALRAWVERHASERFSLSEGPLLRASVLRLSSTEHVIFVGTHHIVTDAWSMGVLVREVGALYEAFLTGDRSPLPELEIQYGDFAVWQRRWLQGEVLSRQVSFWKEQLSGVSPLELPTSRPRPAQPSYRGAVHLQRLPRSLSRQVAALGRECNATVFMTLLAAFDVLLSRYARQEDVCVGTPIANRSHAGLEGLIGFFVNTLVMRADLSGNPSFREVVGRVRDRALAAYAHQDIPFEQVVEAVNVERDLGRHPLFQVMFTLQNAPQGELALRGLTLENVDFETGTAKFDLTLSMVEGDEGLEAGWEYSTDLFDAESVGRMARHFEALLTAVVAEPGVCIGEVELRDEAERAQMVAWNSTEADLGVGRDSLPCLHELFEAQAARTPESVALVFEAERLTYAELNARANQLAHYLRRHGVGPDTVVAVVAERSVEMVVALYGVLKAGGAYLPIDPTYPEGRIRVLLEDAASPVLLTQEKWRSGLPETSAQVVRLDADWPAIEAESGDNPRPVSGPEHLAYVIYTSGSTGKPKGVENSHRGIVNRLLWMLEDTGLGEQDVVLQKTPYTFDVSVWELFAPLLCGARLVVAVPEGHRDPAYLAEVIEAHAITTVHFVPSMLQVFLESVDAGKCRSLRRVICSGEALSRELQERFFSKLGEDAPELQNLYGPTEAAVDVTSWRCRRDDSHGSVPIGKPVANTRIHLLDGQLRPVPVGVAGELYIGGVQVARGYLKRPALTAERFIPDPFSRTPGARLYRTGDLARYRADGEIEYLGRIDFQVKLRGLRIELGEIEAALLASSEVREAAVLLREDRPGDPRLVAYVVPRSERSVDVEAMRRSLELVLPSYMVPSAFVVMPALPVTTSGKLDRKALPAPELEAQESGHEPPRTPVEETLAGIWAEVLGLDAERVSVNANFFELGGHSLLATRVVSRIREALAAPLPLRAVFENTTVASLSKAVERAQREAQGVQAPPLVRVARGDALPLSFTQERLWFLQALTPDGVHYNTPAAVRARGELSLEVLGRVLTEIVRRHEVLRTVFSERGGVPVQVVREPGAVAVSVEEAAAGLGAEERESALRVWVERHASERFSLSEGPLLRASVLRLSSTEHVIFLGTHHIVTDGWSMGVLVREVGALYEAFLAGERSPLPELEIQYGDFAVWQRRWLQGEVLSRQVSFWKEQLSGVSPLELPTSRPRPAQPSYRGAVHRQRLPRSLSRQVAALGRDCNATVFMTLLAAFDVLLSRYARQEDVCVGTPIANRSHAGLEGLIGFFVNTLVMRADLSGNPSFREVVGRVRDRALAAYAHQDIPFEQVVEAVNVERDLGRHPLFQVMFILQNAPQGELSLQGLTLEGVGFETGTAKFDLTLSMVEGDEGLEAGWEYSTDLFDAESVSRMARHFEALLTAVVAEPGVRVGEVELRDEAERAQMVAWNNTETDFGSGRESLSCLHELFEAQVARTPEQVALVFESERLTYAELNARANQLAHHLRRHGVGPDTVVAVVAERSVELVVALYGVLKAGGAYLPIDPTYPEGRIRVLLEDAASPVLLTQEKWRSALPDTSARVMRLDADWSAIEAESGENPRPVSDPEHLAYVIYTSGSTGKPKGVENSHRGIVNRLLWMLEDTGLGEQDVVLQKTPYTFDVSVWELFAPLLCGARLVVAAPEGHRDPAYLAEVIEAHAITTVHFVPSMLQVFLESVDASKCRSLRRVICSGEALSRELQERFFSKLGEDASELQNLYGPTEAAVDVTSWRCRRDDPHASVPIGKPVANTRIHLLDGQLRPVPVGVAGELYIGGVQVARGYLKRPALTAERFIPDPFSRTPGARLYRTGDLGRYRADGEIEYLGRIDFQVKLRGLRIELGEIEAALRVHQGVKDVVVVVWQERLVAYVVPAEPGAMPARAALHELLRSTLPEYMVPEVFVALESLPLTTSGKLDRKALPAPELEAQESGYEPPRTPVEETLAGIWAEVLGLEAERVSVNADFFELGGHSLLATRVVSRIREAFATSLPLRAMFENTTVASLSKAVERAQREAQGVQAPPLVRVPRGDALPLSFTQERLWFLQALTPDGVHYNTPAAVRARGELSLEVLGRVLTEIVRRHEVLRTVFSERDGVPVQVVREPGVVAVAVEEVPAGLGLEEREAALRVWVERHASERFSLSEGPLLRASVLRLSSTEHVIFLGTHHIVTDGWSMGVLVREVGALYEAFLTGERSPLPELEIQYGDFAVWQRRWLQGEVLSRQVSFWKEQLSGVSPLELPTSRPRPAQPSYRGAVHRQRLPRSLSRQVAALGRECNATVFMTLLAAFDVLLSRYARQEDVCVGTPIANRSHAGLEGLIGFFVNTLVMRADLSGNPSFREVVGRVRDRALAAYAHQDIPFEQVVEAVNVERDLGRHPLFQVMFILQNAPQGELSLQGLTLEGVGFETGTAKFDLTLSMVEGDEGLEAGWEYSTDLFDAESVSRMARHFETLLTAVVAEPGVCISEVELRDEAERAQMVAWNSTEADLGVGRDSVSCLHELFEAQAARTPGRTALVFEGESLTYAELNRKANKLAHHLRRHGVGPDTVVAVVAERSVELVVALYGVLKAGGAYLPIDPTYPEGRIRVLLEDAASPVLLTQEKWRSALPGTSAQVVRLDADWSAIEAESDDNPRLVSGPDHLAYVIYTSGSTGRPKGVENSHCGIVNRLLWMLEDTGLGEQDVVLQKTPYTFDVSVWELFAPLLCGARLVVAVPEGHRDPAYLAEVIEAHAITTVHFVPSMLQVFLESVDARKCRSLRRVICSGEALSRELQERFFSKLGEHAPELQNLYGPTEAAVDVTSWRCRRDDSHASVPIGKPVANTRIHLLDGELRPVPVGVAGELYIGGVQVARGYLKRPALTAERFIPDPFSRTPGARLYRTGDLGRYRADGEIEYLGRIDFQVKLRGLRIELGEIEAALLASAEVREAAVLLREDRPGDPRLVAYVVPRSERSVDVEALRRSLELALPSYMVPSAFVVMPALPVTTSGKLDRKALPAPELEAQESGYEPPRTPVEETLAGIWAEVLGLEAERVSVNADFFELGGHSLLATRVVSRIREAFATSLPLRAMFENTTVASLSKAVERAQREAQGVQAPPLVRVARGDALPLSFTQERLWFLQALTPDGVHYNTPAAVRARGELSLEVLGRVLTEIVRRHEVLRTVFSERDGVPVQVVREPGVVAVAVEEATGLGAEEREAALRVWVERHASERFSLSEGPLLRASVLRLSSTEHVIFLGMHHIVTDGWSMGVLVREVGALYEAFLAGEQSPLPELEIQYGDFAVWQRRWLQGEVLSRQVSFWKEQLSGVSPLELPTSRPRPAQPSYRGAVHRQRLPRSLSRQVSALGRECNATVFMTLLAAFDVLLSRYTRQEDVCVGTPIANRSHAGLEGLIGFFVNTLVMRADLSGNPSFREVVGRVRDRALAAYAHQDIPFEQVVEAVNVERDLGRHPLFQVMFILQNAPQGELLLQGLTLEGVGFETGTAKFDLTLSMVEGDEGLEAGWEYSTDLFDAESVSRMARHFEALLTAVVAEPGVRVGEVELRDEAERAQMVAWNNTETDFGTGRESAACVHELFEAQVARTPEQVALVFEGESLTYAELNARANQLAHYLRRLGVGPDTVVAVLDERSVEMVVALLGILKAGGAYLPLDPAYPAQRLAFSIDDARAPVLLTRARWNMASAPAAHAARVVHLDSDWPDIARESAEDPAPLSTAEHLAYVIYTSGSTGKPKGVLIPHKALTNFLHSMAREPGLAARDVLLAVTNITFDIAALELFLPLLRGARIVLAGTRQAADPDALQRLLDAHPITVMQATPATYRMLVDAGWRGGQGLRVLCGGEAMPSDLAAALCERTAAVWNVYGPTETTVWASCLRVEAHDAQGSGAISIGRPIANTTLHILDQRLQPVPVGVPGELYIGGVQVARGYLRRPGLTAERFLPDPFSRERGARMYRTGDLARYRAGGAVEYLGRIDFQVKLRGFRIELGEIEAVLRGHQGVTDVVVVVRQERLVAYVVPAEPGAMPARSALQELLRSTLPEYMVPEVFVALGSLPLTTSGKVDRKALPVPELEAQESGYEPPRTPVEETLAGIWAEVLGLEAERVSVNADFFELGGHSLLATRVVSRIREAFATSLPLRAMFENTTVASLSKAVERAQREAQGVQAPPLVRVARGDALPLSFTQERLWFLQALTPDGVHYNTPAAVRARGELSLEVLGRVLTEIVRRHEVLRTVFSERDGVPVQVVREPGVVAVAVEEATSLGAEEREAALRVWVERHASERFSLSEGPLLRASVLRLSSTEHVIFVGMHHIVTDAWSMGVLVREVGALYEAFLAGEQSPLPELEIQYGDFAVWQRRWLQGEVLSRQVSFWKEQLSGVSPLELPTSRPRPAQPSYRGAVHRQRLPRSLSRQVSALGRECNATVFMTLLAAFDVLLSRYARQEDVCVGTPIANRSHAGLEGLIGFFVNTLVMRADLSGNPSFREVVGRVRDRALAAYAHQDIPFEQVVEAVNVERDLGRHPLFQVMFILQNAPQGELALRGLTLEGVGFETGTAKFDLTLAMVEGDEGLEAGWEYSTDLFDAESVSRMARHFEALLTAVVAEPGIRIGEVELRDEAERAQIVAWNNTEADLGAGRESAACVHELFEAQAARTPEQVALVFEAERLTYAELNARANQLAHHLRRHGVGPDTVVAVVAERSVELVVALYGVLKAGGAYLPIDPTYPGERIRVLLEDAASPVLLTQEKWRSGLPETSAQVVRLDADWPAIEAESGDNPRPVSGPEHLAYVIYTSGSTGKPKGVENSHRGIVNRLRWMLEDTGLGERDVVLQKTPYTFDVSVWELFAPLLCGARLVVAVPDGHRDPAYLAEVIEAHAITTVHFVPSMLQVFLESVDARKCRSLRRVICSGEALSRELQERFFHKLGEDAPELQNLYGPTEAAVDVTSWRCRRDDPHASVPIGKPVANTRIHLLDGGLRPVPVGVAGELYIGGVQVARGYLKRPALTAERFIPDPFSRTPGARLYRTGDLARYRADGEIEYLGRIDFQVKLRGFRIELGEIEAALRAHEAVSDAVVVMRQERLVAYVVPASAADAPSRAALQEFLRSRLPEYMVPGFYVALAALPLTSSGKIDRKALPDPEVDLPAAAHEPPRTPMERALARIWGEVLGVDVATFGIQDDFFALGGHSLLATRVVSRIREQLGVEMPLRSLFEAATLSALAERLTRAQTGRAALPPIRPAPRAGNIPLSYNQQGIWVAAQMGESHQRAYNVAFAFRLRGPLLLPALERAASDLIRRHESLRTRFVEEDGTPFQIIDPAAERSLSFRDLSGAPEEIRLHEASALVDAEAGAIFDLAHEHLFRLLVIRLAAEDHILQIVSHHLVWDGWSSGLVLRDLVASYQAELAGDKPAMPEPPIQYADFAVWQRQLDRGYLDAQLDAWRRALAGHRQNFVFPTDRPYPERVSSEGARVNFRFPDPVRRALLALAQAERCTVFMTALAGFKALLYRHTGQEDLCLGTVVTGRTHVDTEDVVGNFVNALALRSSLRGDPSFRELLGRVRETVLEAFSNQDLPFDRLVEALSPPRSSGAQPYFQVVFALENLPDRGESPEGLLLESFGDAAETTKYDMVLWIMESPQGLSGSLQFRTQLYEPATMSRLCRQYLTLLAAAAEQPDTPISRLEYQAADDKAARDEEDHKRRETSVRRLKQAKPKAIRTTKP
ncbi:NRPS protein [Sorangium cellulosum]|uniref:NRPS protein n=1 Tax=Sorangium cellulosum TaxID=56 RepID=A0A2L0ESM0_SORCE|nr:non-ribosomal peptide synthetase [Sorangium cellulosum]AUX42318.1 NRPS protein [Sorangium cellulosum]